MFEDLFVYLPQLSCSVSRELTFRWKREEVFSPNATIKILDKSFYSLVSPFSYMWNGYNWPWTNSSPSSPFQLRNFCDLSSLRLSYSSNV